ncbi:hypothetical protein [Nocardia sp. NRRL S-836]|uniref:hypothetical protein n=1 Tax=Nocardia sp. NRRL S-836 TaxID=1519492 RepID=UPI0006AE5ED8|nr:hypothetical protein [Nocardia sp. NRRL S-836]KOV85665.1 hypothetical protein ADL03_10175 [Nocardia sp. NRRL S-836]
MIRRFVQLAAITGAALAFMTSTAGATPVTVPTAPGVLACHNADAPTQTPGWVHGKGWGSCAQSVDVFVQRLRAWGWVIEGTAHYNGPGSAVASFNCSGSGYYTYRTLVQWRDGSGPQSAISGESRFNC